MKKGFTLIELLIVVAIIGIIAAIAVPQLVDYIQRARCERTEADVRTLGNSIHSYYIDYEVFPASDFLECIQAYQPNPPAVDAWANPWDYASDGQYYTLTSFARDGVAGPGPKTKLEINPTDELRHDYDIMLRNGTYIGQCR